MSDEAKPETIEQDLRRERGLIAHPVMTTRRLIARLSKPVPANAPPVWSIHVTSIVIASVCAVLFASAFDPLVQPHAFRSSNIVLRFYGGITDAAKSGWYIVPAVIVAAIIGLLDWGALRHGSRRKLMTAYGQAGYILAAVAVAGILTNIIKQFVGRARPRAIDETGVFGFSPFEFDALYQSFPSGHSTTAGSLAVILILWYPRWTWFWIVSMFALACARLPAGAHYPSDVVAGFSVGFVVSLLVARWLARRRAVFVFRGNAAFPVLAG
jgi:membrane-associated phospholipid phosphatase